MQEPSAKSLLISALSPRATVHLMAVVYAKEASKGWDTQIGSEVAIPEAQQWLQLLKEYAEGHMAVRIIWDKGPPEVSL